MSFYSTVCIYHFVIVNKKMSLSDISSPGEFLVNTDGHAAAAAAAIHYVICYMTILHH